MFPLRKKSAKVKKDMQALHKIVGADEDSGQILDKALANARYRVVVKKTCSRRVSGRYQTDLFAKWQINAL